MILYRLTTEEKKNTVLKIAEALGERTREIGPAELNHTLIALCTEMTGGQQNVAGLNAGKLQLGAAAAAGKLQRSAGTVNPVPALYAMPELLIFARITEQKLDDFLERYRMSGQAPVRLKAVMTIHNSVWTVYQLIEELKKEAAHV